MSADDGTSFRDRVWALTERIPAGRVMSYGQIAAVLGSPRAARIVGAALHALPAGTEVPWHRVVNRSGRIVTRCREHSAWIQAERLRDEGVEVDPELRLDLVRYRWWPDDAALEALALALEARFLPDEWADRR